MRETQSVLRTIEKAPAFSRRGHQLFCSVKGCNEETQGGKPCCTEHVDELPYVAEVLANIDRYEQERRNVLRRGARAVEPEGLLAGEILREVRVNGARSAPRLARDLALPLEVVESCLRVLARDQGSLELSFTNRGALCATPVEPYATAAFLNAG